MEKKIDKIAKRNGLGMIKYKMVEELNELIEAIEENDEQHILEEIADVWITTMQYVSNKELEDDYEIIKHIKINRTFERLGIK
jgi:uncharacterized protein YabN with tetrapyrrole methylase and pyrophosphatase domain